MMLILIIIFKSEMRVYFTISVKLFAVFSIRTRSKERTALKLIINNMHVKTRNNLHNIGT